MSDINPMEKLHEEIADLKRRLREATEWRTDEPPRDGMVYALLTDEWHGEKWHTGRR